MDDHVDDHVDDVDTACCVHSYTNLDIDDRLPGTIVKNSKAKGMLATSWNRVRKILNLVGMWRAVA